MDLGPGELAIILVIILLLFGGTKLPQLARSLGQAKREFEKGGAASDAESAPAATPTSTPAPVEGATPREGSAASRPEAAPAADGADHPT